MLSSFHRAIVLAWTSAAILKASVPPLKYTASLGDGANIAAITVDALGSVYVTGYANSALPVTPGAFQTEYKPAMCYAGIMMPDVACPVAFAAKLAPDGTSLAYLTYLGASSSLGTGISVDATGNAWITGVIGTSDLAVTPGALQSSPAQFPFSIYTPGGTAFLLKLDATGSKVLYASYLGDGISFTTINSQALDSSGNLYIAGSTTDSNFPVTAGAFQTSSGPFQGYVGQLAPSAGFVSKFNPVGSLIYSTYFRGSGNSVTSIQAIAVDAGGNACFTGDQSNGMLPTTAGAFQTATTVATSAFVAKLDATGSALVYSTYLSGSTSTNATAIAVDTQANIYVTGAVMPDSSNPTVSFPTTPGAFQAAAPTGPASYLPAPFSGSNPSGINFLAKLNSAGSALTYSTLLSGSSPPYRTDSSTTAIAVDSTGSAVVAGNTDAMDFPPTTAGALFQCQPAGGSGGAGFVMKFTPDGSQVLYSTYLGSSLSSMALDGSGTIYAAISNYGDLFPIVPGSFGETSDNGQLVAALSLAPRPPGSVSCVVSAASLGGYTIDALSLDQIGPAIAPGEVVDIIGYGIGPAQAVTASLVSGQIPISVAGVQVFFNGIAAPLLSVGPNQIRAIVPFEVAPASVQTTQPVEILVQSPAGSVEPFTTTLAPVVPSFFTVDGKPASQGLVINQDGTLNSPQNPAEAGSIVTTYATGLNNTVPPMATGSVATAAAPLAVTVQAGAPSKITYAGAAPDCAAGVVQINFQLPTTAQPGVNEFSLSISVTETKLLFPSIWIATTGTYLFVRGSGTGGNAGGLTGRALGQIQIQTVLFTDSAVFQPRPPPASIATACGDAI